ncbi:molybdenum ABC transporter ATP-binding protein [Cognatishimia sp. D5M38]|uniref:Molybdenum ABC transporter ATP-binding protein n=1 Tax=Cognatishimia coralii TaxID=3083254 RepID=A0ABU8QE34_9RHOB
MSIEVQISHHFQGFDLDVAFHAPAGVTALFGPSGAGKTTIIQSVAGLLTPDEGQITMSGRKVLDRAAGINLSPQKRNIGYVFQEARLFPHLSVSRNLSYGPKARGQAVDHGYQEQIVTMLGLDHLQDRRPQALSGGEKQRVALARALLAKPEVLLLDEPLAALDAARKEEILPYLERLRDHAQVPILYVSHSVSEVARLANHVILLRDGKVAKAGPVEEVFSDTSAAAVLGLRESGAVLRARVTAHHEDGLTELSGAGTKLHLPHVMASVGDDVRLRIKASDVMLSLNRPDGISALNVMEARIEDIHAGQGPGVLVRLACGDAHVLARITQRSAKTMALAKGQTVFAIVKSVSVAQADVGT